MGINYNDYKMSIKEYILYFIISSIAICTIAYIFYRNIYASLFLIPLSVFYIKYKKKDLIKKQKAKLNNQFKDMLYVISASIMSGRSVELTFSSLAEDLSIEYKNQNDFIIKEALYIKRKLSLNENLDDILRDFANRSGLDDIKNFVNVFIVCKRTGGNISSAVNETYRVISEKIKICNDINTAISARKFEYLILNILPFGLIIVISLMSKGYFNPLYESAQGRLISSLSLLFILISNYLSYKIIDIKV